MFFRNENLRGAGEEIPMTEDEINKYISCSQDIFTFANYFTIVGPNGEEFIKLRPYQDKLVKTITANIPGKPHRIIMMGRQTGKTTIATLYLLWYALFHENKTIALLANKESQASEILTRIKNAYVKMPMWLQQGLVKWNSSEIVMENGTKIFAAASSTSSIRGKTIDLMLIDEFAHLEENIANDFMLSVFPTLASRPGAMMLLISTPRGMNHFYDVWQKAKNGNSSFIPCKIQWFEVEGRDEAWKDQQIKDNGPIFFAQEYACLGPKEKVKILNPNGLEEEITLEDLYIREEENV